MQEIRDVLQHVLSDFYSINSFICNDLDAYENLNLHIISNDLPERSMPEEFVMKISEHSGITGNGGCSIDGLEFQFEVMQHLQDHGITTTSPVSTMTGQLTCQTSVDPHYSGLGRSLHIYMLRFVPGITLREAGNPLSLMKDVGRLAGKIDAALQTFNPTHQPVEVNEEESWVLPNVTMLETRLAEFCDDKVTSMGLEILQQYRESVLPVIDTFQKGYIHGDLHNCNIIVDRDKPTAGDVDGEPYRVSGVIDFGDTVQCFYVFEICILIADLMASCLDTMEPLHIANLVLTGYRQELELSQQELSILRLCLCLRLLHYYVLSGISILNDPGNDYLNFDRDKYLEVFQYLFSVSEGEFTSKVLER